MEGAEFAIHAKETIIRTDRKDEAGNRIVKYEKRCPGSSYGDR